MENKHTDKDLENHLLQLVRDFILEIKSERVLSEVSLDASIEKDLGIDSLGRVELFLRIEKQFGVHFPETTLVQAETLKDILTAIQSSQPEKKHRFRDFVQAPLETREFDLSHTHSLVDVLVKHAAKHPNRPHIYLMNEKEEETIITYGNLLDRARLVAQGLIELGLQREETVAIMLPTGEDFFYAFFGTLLAGGIPVPIYPPFRPDKIEEYALREAAILNNAEVRILITFSQVETLGRLLRVFIKSLYAVTTVQSLRESKKNLPTLSLEFDDPAMIQYTSGSTSDPKGVLLTHANLLSNIRAVGKAAQLSTKDVGISWLPLYHDMGLIGAWFSTLYHGFPLTIMSPMTFLSRPERWLWAIHYHRGTVSAGPNFAYELCVRRIKEEDIVGLDLSSWRLAFNGAEAINPATLASFTKKFAPYGFRPETFYPVYGLAECSVGLTFPVEKRKPRIDAIQREPFEKEQKAIPATSNHKEADTLSFVCCGQALPDHEIRIVDEQGQELPERRVGTLEFTGPSAMKGYFRNPEATNQVYRDGWWDSGDYAYLAENEVFITGRKKDLIIKAGRNLYPQEIEEAVSQVSGVRRGCSVAFGVADKKSGTEKIVIVAETAENKPNARHKIVDEIIEKVTLTLGVPPDEVCLVPPRTVPKTSSGKLQRSACKKMYLENKLTKPHAPVWWQMTKLMVKGSALTMHRFLTKMGQISYTLYIGILLCLFALPMWLTVFLLPKRGAQFLFRVLIQLFLFFAAIRIEIRGKENRPKLKSQKIVYVSNHASYADAVILMSVLPKNVLFVGKQEILHWPFINTLFKKFGYLSVDRLDFTKNIQDATKIEESLKLGNPILIFPEGTFTYATGLRPFKMGAFKIAVESQSPICPISLQGTRDLLRSGSFLFSPSKITVTFSKLIVPEAKTWSEVTRLHALTRAEIVKHCGELSLDFTVAGLDPR